MSTEREAELLQQYEPFILRTVRSYSHANGRDTSFDDMLQEARLAFLLHLRKIPDEAHIFPCRLSLIHALYNHTANAYGVSLPSHRLKEQREKFAFMSLDAPAAQEVGDVGACVAGMDCETSLAYIMKQFSPEEQKMAQMLVAGYRKSEVRRRMGLCNSNMYRRVNDMRHKMEAVYGWM